MNRLKEIPIKEHDNQYFASENGKIYKWSGEKEEFSESVGWLEKSYAKGVLLYWRIGIYLNGIRKKFYKHRLILFTFKDFPNFGEEARHLDGISTNNANNNLEWGTSKENKQDIKKHNKRHPDDDFPHPDDTKDDDLPF